VVVSFLSVQSVRVEGLNPLSFIGKRSEKKQILECEGDPSSVKGSSGRRKKKEGLGFLPFRDERGDALLSRFPGMERKELS